MTTAKPNDHRIALADRLYDESWDDILATYLAAKEDGIQDPVIILCDLRSAPARDMIGSVFGDDERNRLEAINAADEGGTTLGLAPYIAAAPLQAIRDAAEDSELISIIVTPKDHWVSTLVYVDFMPIAKNSRYEWGPEELDEFEQ